LWITDFVLRMGVSAPGQEDDTELEQLLHLQCFASAASVRGYVGGGIFFSVEKVEVSKLHTQDKALHLCLGVKETVFTEGKSEEGKQREIITCFGNTPCVYRTGER